MEDLDFDSCDLGLTEEFLSRTYGRMRIRSDDGQPRTRLVRRWLGGVNVDDLTFSCDMTFSAEPLQRICLCRVHSGHIEVEVTGEPKDVLVPGDLTLLTAPDLPYSGRLRHAHYDLTMFDAAQLERVIAKAPNTRSSRVRLTGRRPVSVPAARQLSALIDYVRSLAAAETKPTELLTATAIAHLAAGVLNAFPNNALTEPTAADRNAALPALLRRAMAYIDEHAHSEIAIADIAAHVYATPRAVQYVFRRNLDITPTQYLQRVRLERAHRELVMADQAVTTVSAVAARWGFAHPGRFASLYRQTYGRSPRQTLVG